MHTHTHTQSAIERTKRGEESEWMVVKKKTQLNMVKFNKYFNIVAYDFFFLVPDFLKKCVARRQPSFECVHWDSIQSNRIMSIECYGCIWSVNVCCGYIFFFALRIVVFTAISVGMRRVLCFFFSFLACANVDEENEFQLIISLSIQTLFVNHGN